MATILNAVQYTTGTTLPFTLSAGANRRIVVDEYRVTGAGNVVAGTGLSLGGVAGRFEDGSVAGATYPRIAVRTYSWGESEIAAMSNSNLASTGGSGGTLRYMCLSIQDTDQAALATSNFLFVESPSVSTGSLSLARTDGGFTKQSVLFGVNSGIAFANPAKNLAGTNNHEHIGYQSDNSATPPVATFSGNTGLNRYAHVVVNYPTAPLQTITDINSGGDVSGDTSGNTFATTGFTESITDVTIGGLDCIDVVESPAGSGTFTVPPPVHLSTYPEIGVNQDVVISGATESATLAKPFVLNGYTVTALVDPEIVDLTYPTAHFDVTPITDDLMITATADLTPSADGGITTDAPKTTIIMHWVRSTDVMYIYSFVINGGGVVASNGAIIMRPMSASGIVMRSLTMRGM